MRLKQAMDSIFSAAGIADNNIMSLNLTEEGEILQERCREEYNWSKEQSKRAVEAYVQFLDLKAQMNDWEATILSPSPIINKVWRLHVLDTRAYLQTCQAYARRFIHYDSVRGFDVISQNKRIETTKIAVMARFGHQTLEYAEWHFNQEACEMPARSEDAALFSERPTKRQCKVENNVTTPNAGDSRANFAVSICGVGEPLYFLIRPTTMFKRMINAYAENRNINADRILFLYNGRHILPGDLPCNIGLSNGDVIDVIVGYNLMNDFHHSF